MKRTLLVLCIFCAMFPATAHAYVGPGLGLSAVGTMLALVGIVVLTILGFVWYPLKRMLGLSKRTPKDKTSGKA